MRKFTIPLDASTSVCRAIKTLTGSGKGTLFIGEEKICEKCVDPRPEPLLKRGECVRIVYPAASLVFSPDHDRQSTTVTVNRVGFAYWPDHVSEAHAWLNTSAGGLEAAINTGLSILEAIGGPYAYKKTLQADLEDLYKHMIEAGWDEEGIEDSDFPVFMWSSYAAAPGEPIKMIEACGELSRVLYEAVKDKTITTAYFSWPAGRLAAISIITPFGLDRAEVFVSIIGAEG